MGRGRASPPCALWGAGGEGRAPSTSPDGATSPGQPRWLCCRRERAEERGSLASPCRGVRCSHRQVPPSPAVSSLAVLGVGVRQPGGGLGAGLHRLHPLLQAAAGEHHVPGADVLGPRLPQVLLAVPDAVAEVDEQTCSGEWESGGLGRGWRLAGMRRRSSTSHGTGGASTSCLQVGKDPGAC